jgi:hypothetical protein
MGDMNNVNTITPRWFVILAMTIAIWNLMGMIAFMMQITMTVEQVLALPEKEQILYQDIPLWVNIAFGCAVTGGLLGCVALAFKKAIALPILIISLLGVLVQKYYSFITVDAFDVYGPGGTIMPMMVLIIALYLVWLANSAKAKGWIC